MSVRSGLVAMAVAMAPAVGGAEAWAGEPGRFELGVRGVLTAADGTPANDIPGYGLFGRYRLSGRWAVGAAVDLAEYDFEQPARILGLEQDPAVEPIDVLAESTVVSAWLERTFGREGGPTTWYLGAGLGMASIDVPEASGPLRAGGTFRIRTEADDELIPFVLAGVRRNLGSRLALDFALRGEQHLADWQLTDQVSGRRGAIDDYTAFGGQLGLGLRF